MQRQILLIDDDENIRKDLADLCEVEGYDVTTASSGREALDLFRRKPFRVVVSDIKMPEKSGLQVLTDIKQLHPPSQVILISGNANLGDIIRAINLDTFGYVEKGNPKMLTDLLQKLEEAFQRYDELIGKATPELRAQALEPLAESFFPPPALSVLDDPGFSEPETFDDFIQHGLFHSGNRQYGEAQRCFERACELNSRSPVPLYHLGNLHIHRGEPERAIALLKEAVDLDNTAAECFYSLGVAHGRRGDPRQAVPYLQRALELRPDYPQALRSIGAAFGEMQLYDEAAKALEAGRRRPEDLGTFLVDLSLALIHRENDAPEKAVIQLRKALETRPDDPFVLILLGMICREIGDREGYKENFHDAFSADPGMAVAVYEIESQRLRRLEAERARLETRQGLLNSLTHTLRNTCAGGKPTIRGIRSLLEDFEEADAALIREKVIRRLQVLELTFDLLERNFGHYEFITVESKFFAERWAEEGTGPRTAADLLALSLRQPLCQLLFLEGQIAARKRLAGVNKVSDLKTLRQTLQEKGFSPYEADETQAFLAWLESHVSFLEVNLGEDSVGFRKGGMRFTFLYVLMTEIVFNALKYSDGSEPICVEWRGDESYYLFSVDNSFSSDSIHFTGSGKGQEFLDAMAGLLPGLDIVRDTQDDHYRITLKLDRKLLQGGTKK